MHGASAPLVSCVLATRNRARFLPQALRCFLRRTYAAAELIVVDDSDRPVASLCRHLPGVRYIRLTEPTPTGTKLNLGIAEARGSVIQKLDDDDYYAPTFLAGSVRHLPRRDDLSRTIVTRCCFLVLLRKSQTLHHSGHDWSPGGAFCFHRSLWEQQPFRDVEKSEDSILLRDLRPRIVRICDVEKYIVLRHGRNTWRRVKADGVAQRVDGYFACRDIYKKTLRDVVPHEDLQFYRALFRWR
jgi:glycosyltransferase involved in cell wall biosynthesis